MKNSIPSNPILDKLPAHLHQYIIPQNYEHYSAIDQAVWRYVMRKNVVFLSKLAHHTYVEGLKQTGVSIERIPNMYGMNRILKDLGWAAAAVDGFIPPAAFMEFQAYNVLVIAADIRLLEHIEYTSAPDIIHESAGHAPIIANPEYAEYLRRLGEIGSKAIASAHDWDIYTAVRKLSQLKELADASLEAIEKAQKLVDELQSKEIVNSEMARIRNLQWWTVEYGLIGTIEDYKIYGAGLLSSIGESEWCMSNHVKKIPYTIEAADQNFDITRPQPQLFVTPDFAHLSMVLDEFANEMALRKGGLKGVQQLIDSKNLGSIELSTGLQISGVFSKVLSYDNRPVFIQTIGPTALSYREKELIGHSRVTHPNGFGSPIGKLKGINIAIEDMSPRDLEAYHIYEGREACLEFEGGIKVSGKVITGTRNLMGKILLISFVDCTVTYKNEILFNPENGIFHLAVGKEVVSAFAGPADLHSFNLMDHKLTPKLKVSPKSNYTISLEMAYQQVRDIREKKTSDQTFSDLCSDVLIKYPNEWLLNLESYELAKTIGSEENENLLLNNLDNISTQFPRLKHLIDSGLEMINVSLNNTQLTF